MTRRTKAAERLARLEAEAPPSTSGGPSREELEAMTDAELWALADQILASVEPDPRWAKMSAEELHAEARRLCIASQAGRE